MTRVNVFKITEDNWAPSYNIEGYYDGSIGSMLVEVTFTGQLSDGCWRVCVWGGDDCGMELDHPSEAAALTTFMQVIGMECVNFKDLLGLGFVPA